jgi:hypothetical protein
MWILWISDPAVRVFHSLPTYPHVVHRFFHTSKSHLSPLIPTLPRIRPHFHTPYYYY